MSRVVVQDYDPAWPKVFESLRARIWPLVSDIAIAIEHVGSTSVPGLAAKPIIDIDIVVAPPRVDPAIERLATVGYEHRGDLGIRGREAFAAPGETPRHHLYLCPCDSAALANHLAVRDALRRSASDVHDYGELKKRLAGEFAEDVEGYVEAKTEFLVGLLEKAGFPEEDLAEIRSAKADTRDPGGRTA